MNLKLFLVALLGFSFHLQTLSQSGDLRKTHPVVIAVPHLPEMIKYNGEGKPFYGEKFKYKKNENEDNVHEWIKAYPEEYKKYKTVIAEYMKATDPETLSADAATLYYDLKAQWLMIRQLVND